MSTTALWTPDEVVALLESLVEEHSAHRRGDRTYDTARAVLLDLLHDFRRLVGDPR